jgi:hypothetical protein
MSMPSTTLPKTGCLELPPENQSRFELCFTCHIRKAACGRRAVLS